MENEQYNDMQLIKRSMYAMRNGIVADALRKAGSPFKIIFGANLPQLSEIAAAHGHDQKLAEQLWADKSTRESMLIAPMLMPAAEMTNAMAHKWVESAVADEAIDVLCLKLLRHMAYAVDLANEFIADSNPKKHYAGLRLMCNLAPMHPAEAVAAGRAEAETGNQATRQLVDILLSYEDLLLDQ